MKIPEYVGNKTLQQHINILLNSYQQCFAEPLINNEQDPLMAICNAAFVVVSHGTEADPIFNFANQTALQLFELDYSAFTQLPSRHSAESISQIERDKLLAEVSEKGGISNYTGVRISASGKRFYIKNSKVWNLYDETGAYYGQAASFNSWEYI